MKNELKQVVKETSISSIEVSEMIEKEHRHLLRDIRLYSEYLNESKIGLVDFWEESTYSDSKGESRPCYLVTKKGCEFLAHKMRGKKGTVFTARYINRFHEMENELKNPTLTDNRLEIARLILSAPESKLSAILELYPEYFSHPNRGSLEYMSDINTSYTKWIEDYGITADWISHFPTLEVFNNYVRYCVERNLLSMGKKYFYKTLENDFNFTRRQGSDGYRYFIRG